MVTVEQLMIAAEWLEHNEGQGEEGAACAAVADWLQKEIERRLTRQLARILTHELDLPVTRAIVMEALNQVAPLK